MESYEEEEGEVLVSSPHLVARAECVIARSVCFELSVELCGRECVGSSPPPPG
jgi:hypothetical protein